MSGSIPCPVCGSETGAADEACGICGFSIRYARESNAGGGKCARCGSAMPSGFDFCPVCGQDQRARMRRPPTQQLRIHPAPMSQEIAGPNMGAPPQSYAPMAGPPAGLTVPAPGSGMPAAALLAGAQMPAGSSPLPPRAPADGGYTMPAPGLGVPPAPAPMPAGLPPPMPAPGQVHVDRTVPAPGLAAGGAGRPAPGSRDLPFSPFDAPSGPPVSELPAIVSREVFEDDPTERMSGPLPPVRQVSDDDRTMPDMTPRPRRAQVGEDDKTIPVGAVQASHKRTLPALLPDPAPESDKTRPDRPGEFSGGPMGQRPSPTVNVPRHGPGTGADPAPPSAPYATPSRTPTSPGRAHARLVIVGRDGSEGESFQFSGSSMAVGRSHGDLLFPEDPFLSPVHVRIQRADDGTMVLLDTGSTNGVYLRIRGHSPVYPGDLFMIGHQLLRLENLDGQVQETPAGHDGTRMFGTPLQPAWGRLSQIGRGGVSGDHFYLRGARVVLGREDGDLVFPNDPYVSRAHACLKLEITGQTMSVYLEDLKSANGTYVRIRGSARIGSMDTFRIGDQILRLRLD
jgi:pSer/pThr/pTyr-binding forkhead associated (FHA) protein